MDPGWSPNILDPRAVVLRWVNPWPSSPPRFLLNRSPGSGKLVLCPDILIVVFELLDVRADVFALMRASKALYVAGAPRLLAFGVRIRKERQLASFVRFVVRGLAAPVRLAALRQVMIHVKMPLGAQGEIESESDSDSDDESDERSLDVSELEGDDDDGDDDGSALRFGNDDYERRLWDVFDLTDILRKAPRLEDLAIDSAEWLLQFRHLANPSLMDVLAKSRTLRRLRLHSFGPCSLRVIQRIRAPLVSVDLNYFMAGRNQPPDSIELLAPFRDTLEKITVWHAEFGTWPVVRDLTKMPQFPRVRSLTARELSCGLDLALLMHLFPNLSSLEMTDFREWPPGDDGDLGVARERNKLIPTDGVWDDLHLSGDVDSLDALGLEKQVERLEIEGVAYGNTEDGYKYLLQTMRPAKLLLHIGYRVKHWTGIREPLEIGEGYLQLIDWQQPVCDQITHLALDVKEAYVNSMRESFLFYTYGFLSTLPKLRMFILRVQENPVNGAADEDIGESSNYAPSDLEEDGINWWRWLMSVAVKYPDLELISIDADDVGVRYAQVVRTPEGAIGLKILEPSIGAKIIEDEDMEWGRREIFVPPVRS